MITRKQYGATLVICLVVGIWSLSRMKNLTWQRIGIPMLILLGLLLSGVFAPRQVGADSWSETTFITGTFSNTTTTTGSAEVILSKTALDSVTWSTMAAAPANISQGGALVSTGGDFIYGFRGGVTGEFYRYSISGNSWSTMAQPPGAIGYGGALAYPGSGDFIYALRGGGQVNFYCYSISGNSWTTKASAPGGINEGGSLVSTGGNFIYGFRGDQTDIFYRYSISGNSWSTMTGAPGTIGYGGALAYPGSGDFIYAFKGELSTAFYRYSISGNSWATMTAVPGTIANDGSALVSAGGNYIYAFRGELNTTFYRYSISSNSWVTMTAAPGTISDGGSLVYTGSGDFIYGFRGGTTTDYYRCKVIGFASPGSYTSAAIAPAGVGYWGIVTYTKTTPANTILTVDVLSSSNDTVLAANLPYGTDLKATYPAAFTNIIGIKLRANFSTTDNSQSPTLSDWYIAYDRSPVLTSPGNKSINENQLLTFTLSATDPDGDPITYTMTATPTGSTLNSTSGVFSWTPSYTQSGNYTVTFTATAKTLFNSKTITITVNDIPGFTNVTTTAWTMLTNGNTPVRMGQSIAYVKFNANTISGTARWKKFRIDKGVTGVATPCPDNKIEVQIWMEN
ncbi:MAG: putative Ig domain-containing protein, partial [Planctomycetes bacterium]|nr:putative Ig domain-containing protein [Planctomycetota bacterium]